MHIANVHAYIHFSLALWCMYAHLWFQATNIAFRELALGSSYISYYRPFSFLILHIVNSYIVQSQHLYSKIIKTTNPYSRLTPQCFMSLSFSIYMHKRVVCVFLMYNTVVVQYGTLRMLFYFLFSMCVAPMSRGIYYAIRPAVCMEHFLSYTTLVLT